MRSGRSEEEEEEAGLEDMWREGARGEVWLIFVAFSLKGNGTGEGFSGRLQLTVVSFWWWMIAAPRVRHAAETCAMWMLP